METIIIESLKSIEKRKRENHREPTTPLYYELQTEIINTLKTELNKMYTGGKIEVGKTINDKYIKLVEK